MSLWREKKNTYWTNVHAHLHSETVMYPSYKNNDIVCADDRYISVCVERINYTPISLDAVKRILADRFYTDADEGKE